jgi:hypothetical protein
LLDEGAALCHCSAVKHDGRVVIFPAWRDVGKTNLLLTFLPDGAQYIADDLCIVTDDGTVYSLPKRLNLLHYNFQEYPSLLEKTPQEFQQLMEFVERARSGEFDLDEDAIQTLTNQARMRISPYRIFDQQPTVNVQQIDDFFLLRRKADETDLIECSPLDPTELAHRMYATMEFEMYYFLLGYQVHKAQMGEINPCLEEAKAKHLDVYKHAISAANAYTVTVPSQNRSKEAKSRVEATMGKDE